ncbi:MAG TPA: hypothetical protein VIL86_08520 [Tepidisphaeraceae bacterium]
MAQATVDLPDPLDQPAMATSAGADDLLSQLAGDEIDRMLAEADVESGEGEAGSDAAGGRTSSEINPTQDPNPNVGASVETVAASAESVAARASDAESSVSAELDQLFAEMTEQDRENPVGNEQAAPGESAAVSASAPPAAVKSAPEPASISAQATPAEKSGSDSAELDALFNELTKEGDATAGRGAVSPAPPGTSDAQPSPQQVDREIASAAGALQEQLAQAADDDSTSHAEREALVEKSEATAAAATTDAAEDAAEVLEYAAPEEEQSALPMYLKPLEWLNAPLAACPESVREAIGKVAILTLLNGAGLLAYVLIFRRHH